MSKPAQNKASVSNPPELKLFVAGRDTNSLMALQNLESLCREHFKDNYKLEIINVLEQFDTALKNDVLVAPTLIITSIDPPVRIIGSLRDDRKVRYALGISAPGAGV